MHRINLILLLTCLAVLPSLGQTPGKNYVMTETMLNSSGTRKIVAVQYYDGLGRPSELAEGGISGSGGYLHSLQTYDALGRESVTTLPGAISSTPDFAGLTPTSTSLSSSYGGDTRPFSQTTYDALGRPVFISTPGQSWTGKGKSITYVTNGENEVKRYKGDVGYPQQDGYYPAGALTGEVATDEDGIAVTTFRDLAGRVVLERRGTDDDTYFVYNSEGLRTLILQPMYQESGINGFRFRNKYDDKGRATWTFRPGGSYTNHWYDGANRLIAVKEPSRKTRYFFYDGLGRLVIQACHTYANAQNVPIPLIASRSASDNSCEISHTGYYVDSRYVPSGLKLEIVNYYDDYAFFSSGIFTDSIPAGNFQTTNSSCTSTLKTADITATSDGHLLARVYYYDDKGRVIDTRENLLGGEFLQTTTEYSFTDKPTQTTKTIDSPNTTSLSISEYFTYDDNTDKLKYHDITYNDQTQRISEYTYNSLGQISVEKKNDDRLGIIYTYNIQGWPKSITATRLTGWTDIFKQNLYYETPEGGTPCYNGNISAMTCKTGTSYGHGYKYTYDNRNRLTSANYTFYDLSNYPISLSERVTYNRNSSPVALKRFGSGTGEVLDSLLYSYTGNQLMRIIDVSGATVREGVFEFVNGVNKNTEYYYNSIGDLLCDANKGIARIDYDNLGHPVRIQFTNGSCTEYVYAADGRKLREKHTTAVEGLTVNPFGMMELTPSQIMASDALDYAGNIRYRYERSIQIHQPSKLHLDYHFDGGFLNIEPLTVISPDGAQTQVYRYHPYYFFRDYQGSNRLVVDEYGNIVQANDYYPYGGPHFSTSTNQAFQPYKYNGKELDRVHGLDWYDYGARRYDPAFCLFTQIDPLAEKYPHLNPYVYCAGNPVRFVDPDGRHIRVTKKDGVYNIEGGEVDDDLNIYDVTYGWGNRVSIGKALTQYSFFDDNGNPVIGSIINLNDKSGQEFLTDFVSNTPSILTYIFNATEGKKYDFKRQDAPGPGLISPDLYNNRGMKVSINGNNYIASARDIGNYAAGYIVGQNGLTWTETRIGFDALETRQHHFLPSIEGRPSQYAQFKGYTSGLKSLSLAKTLKLRLIEYKLLKMLFP